MQNENRTRLVVFAVVVIVHLVLLLFVAVNISAVSQAAPENARVMKVTDLMEEIPPPPPPPPPPEEEIPLVEEIAEIMIETDIVPEPVVATLPSITTPSNASVASPWDEYLPMHLISVPPRFNEREIIASIIYPPIAFRSGVEGRVMLELFVDKNGFVQRIRILQEEPLNRGFGEAAINALTGKRAVPAEANGEAVSARFRYPVRFTLR